VSKPGVAQQPSDASRLNRLAWEQHGVVGDWQLLALGWSRQAIRTLIRKGHLVPIHRGVYAVGHTRLSHKGRWMAAVLAFGPGAGVLSHGHAAALHDLRTVPSTAIDVTSPLRRKPERVRAHWARSLDPLDTTTVDGIPVTTVARVLLDQAERLSAQRLRTLLEATLRRDVFDLTSIEATIARNPGRHGIAPLTEALAELPDEAPWTQSEKERHFLEFARAYGLPEPSVNVVVLKDPVDFFWPAAKLIVEVDGWESHKTHAAFEADRVKDAKHHVAGYLVLRITARRIDRDAPAVAGEIRALLRRGSELAAASGR
jgi:very-short-patch-repair endonuclease